MTLCEFVHNLAQLFDCLEDVLAWVKDREDRYRWVNRAFFINFPMNDRRNRQSGGPHDVLGKTDHDLSSAFLTDQYRLDDEHVLARNRIVDRIEMVGQPDGLTVWNLTNKITLLDATGGVIGTACLTRTLNSRGQKIAPEIGFGPVLSYTRDQNDLPITTRQLARLAHMSVSAFDRKFQVNFHLTPQKYMRKLRMRMPSRTFVSTPDSMAEVAIQCGFSDQSHFTREFRRHFARTPRDYREHSSPGDDPAAPVTNPGAEEQASTPPSNVIVQVSKPTDGCRRGTSRNSTHAQ